MNADAHRSRGARSKEQGARWLRLGLAPCFLLLASLIGCSNPLADRRPATFAPTQLRINPTFTRLRSFDSDDRPDGIEADVELRDGFGDPTKAAGTIYFELFEYDPDGPDVRGQQIGEAEFFDLSTVGAQRRHWQNVVRTYRFRLDWPNLQPAEGYVLSATYDPPTTAQGTRLFDRLVVTPRPEPEPMPATRP